MAVKRVLPVAIGMTVVALLIAVLILFFSSAPPPAVSVVAPELEPPSEPHPSEPGRLALTTLEGAGEAEPESAGTQTSEERQRAQFIRNVRVGGMRNWLGEGVPVHVVRLFAAGRMREGAEHLIRMGREGDATGYEALRRLLGVCPGPGGDRDFERGADTLKLRNDAMIADARLRGTPEHILTQLRWSLDAGNANKRGVWAEFCPGPGQGDVQAILAEVHTVLPEPIPLEVRERLHEMDVAERDRTLRELQPAVDAARAQAKTLQAEVGQARMELRSQDPERRRAAFERLLDLAERSPNARLALAMCLRSQCVPDAGGSAEALSFYIEAARAGSLEAMEALSRRDTTDPFSARPRTALDLPIAERYGWHAVREEVIASGCYGLERFARWGFAQPPRSPPLMALSPADAQAAETRAKEMIRTELPAIRAAIGCD